MRYLLNAPVLPNYGEYLFDGPLSRQQARTLARGGLHSAVGHQSTTELLSEILDIEVTRNRQSVHMQPGDQALVLHMLDRLPEGMVMDARQLVRHRHALALLTRKR